VGFSGAADPDPSTFRSGSVLFRFLVFLLITVTVRKFFLKTFNNVKEVTIVTRHIKVVSGSAIFVNGSEDPDPC
jgi:hypothetical protein